MFISDIRWKRKKEKKPKTNAKGIYLKGDFTIKMAYVLNIRKQILSREQTNNDTGISDIQCTSASWALSCFNGNKCFSFLVFFLIENLQYPKKNFEK